MVQAVDGVKTFPVLNMLNTKYFILPLQGGVGTMAPIQNPYAQGNGWFVNKLNYVDDANAEYAEVGKIDVRHEAVADKKFEAVWVSKGKIYCNPKLDTYELTTAVHRQLKRMVVLSSSEIYYPGWTATMDGQPAELGRVNLSSCCEREAG